MQDDIILYILFPAKQAEAQHAGKVLLHVAVAIENQPVENLEEQGGVATPWHCNNPGPTFVIARWNRTMHTTTTTYKAHMRTAFHAMIINEGVLCGQYKEGDV